RMTNCTIYLGIGAGVGMGNSDAAEGLSRNFAGQLSALEPELVPQGVVLVCVSMRPTVDGNRGNVSRGIEATRTECARKLLANFALNGFEISCEQFNPAHTMLVTRGKPRLAGSFEHVNHDGLIG